MIVESYYWLSAVALLLVTLPGTLELALITFGALLPKRSRPAIPSAAYDVRLAVIIPAYNEELGLPATLRSLLSCDDPPEPSDIVVVADNCTDRTADIARSLGCGVLERIDPSRRGKGYGLNHAFRELENRGYAAYVIVDADTVVDRKFLNEFRALFARGAAAGQCVYKVANPEANIRTRLMNIAFLAFTFLRPLARHRLGLSAGIFGNGFGLCSRTLAEIPNDCFSLAEDLEYHTKLVRAGKIVEFLPGTSVSAQMCTTALGAKPQRERWEGGRFRIMAEQAPRLALDVFVRGRLRLLEPLLDLLLLPLAYHMVLLTLLLVMATDLLLVYACVALLLVIVHVGQAMVLGGADPSDWKALAAAPVYVIRKLLNLGGILKAARKTTLWRRTQRDNA